MDQTCTFTNNLFKILFLIFKFVLIQMAPQITASTDSGTAVYELQSPVTRDELATEVFILFFFVKYLFLNKHRAN
ncbi:hypothetical protein C5167_044617 [Papaver somniferum]|uniref:Uncharacterized protein n=1 Tax=Papaver somniferum TaxID=3469 RepID=A0A4Y7L922_PAPSO|nr:hypothetical protein C5167_044617 [Papaver somniferum]